MHGSPEGEEDLMTITIKRLHELSKKELKAVRALLRREIDPADTTKGSSWVCQKLQQAHFWGIKMLERVAERDKETAVAWAAFDSKVSIGACIVLGCGEIRLFTCFLTTDHPDSWEIADAIALPALKDLAADGCVTLTGWFPKLGWAAEYARRCGFKSEEGGTTIIPDPNPLLCWTIGVKELEENILKESDAN